MISKEDREKAIYLMDDAPIGTVAIIMYTDGRLNPTQKVVFDKWALLGSARRHPAKDIIDVMNIEKVSLLFEGKD